MINSYLTKTELQQKQEVSFKVPRFFDTQNSKNIFFFSIISVKHTQTIHTSVIMNTEVIHMCTVKFKKGSDSVL